MSEHHDHLGIEAARLELLAPGIYAYIQPDGGWYVNNSTVLVGDHSVIVIDAAATEARTRGLLSRIREITPLPVSTLLNTHWHTDHTNGNYLFRPATIVSQQLCRQSVIEYGVSVKDPSSPFPDVEWGNLEVAPPFLTFESQISLFAGDSRAEFRFVGFPAHTTSDSYVWLEQERILVTGDLVFAGCTPLFSGGSLAGSRAAVQQLAALKPKLVVPGHGDVCGPEVFEDLLGYYDFVESVARSAHSTGSTPLEACLALGEHAYSHWLDSERLVANVHRALAEFTGQAPGSPIDLPATRRDMIALNGGEPLRCFV